MLLPNTMEVRTAIERWNRRFNDWLSEQFGISLFLAHGYTACSGNELIDVPAEQSPYKKMFRPYPLRWLGTSCTAMMRRQS